MAGWKEERDRLVAQTLAFVQQVASAHPTVKPVVTAAMDATPREAVSIDASPSASTSITDQPCDISQSDARGSTAGPIPAQVVMTSAKTGLYSLASERADILQRVSAFKARQSQMGREREAYYETMQARIRTSLGNQLDRDGL
jgi:hypothetical protein